MVDGECVVVFEEINSSNNMLYKSAAAKMGRAESTNPKDESGFDLLFTYYIDSNYKPYYYVEKYKKPIPKTYKTTPR